MEESNFWHNLPRPFFALAPMADVTDTVFRQVIARRGRPDVFWTEFVSCDGLCSRGREMLLRDLSFSEIERPIVAQVFGANPKNFYETAQLIASLGFDGIDINMGCPEKNIQKQGACAALMKNPALAQEIILATKEGVCHYAFENKWSGESVRAIPVSVKTRIGYNALEIDSWIPKLLERGLAALTVHLRTKREMSDVPAHWDLFPRIVEMAHLSDTIIIGNGDVKDMTDGRLKAEETGADGIMIGRAIFGNPWLFDSNMVGKVPKSGEKLAALVEHTKLYESTWGKTKGFDLMKKHYKAYANGFRGAGKLRAHLMECETGKDVEDRVQLFLSNNDDLISV